MKVIVPFCRLSPETDAALLRDRIEPRFVNTQFWDEAYWNLMKELWEEGETFIVLEQDKVPNPGAIQALWDCPELWCTYPVPTKETGKPCDFPSLSCTKFDAVLMKNFPDLIDLVGSYDYGYGPRHWNRLDFGISGLLGSFVAPHWHEADRVGHVHTFPVTLDTPKNLEEAMSDVKPVKKKVYAEVRGTVSFVAPSREDAEKLVNNFFARKGITQYGYTEYTNVTGVLSSWGPPDVRVTFEASYRVHGGWRSDFVKKVESDAQDMNVTITQLEVNINRIEIPAECPRKDCVPCSFQLGVTPAYAQQDSDDQNKIAVRGVASDPEISDMLLEELDKPGVREKLRQILGR